MIARQRLHHLVRETFARDEEYDHGAEGPLFSAQVVSEFLAFFGPSGPDTLGVRAH